MSDDIREGRKRERERVARLLKPKERDSQGIWGVTSENSASCLK